MSRIRLTGLRICGLLVMVGALSGCATLPGAHSPNTAGASASPTQSRGAGSAEPNVSAAQLAAGFPTDVPLLGATIVSSSSVGSGASLRWIVDLQLPDPSTTPTSIEKAFTDSGYSLSSQNNIDAFPAEGAQLSFHNTNTLVTVNLAKSADGLFADYTVSATATASPPSPDPGDLPDSTGVPADFPAGIPLVAGTPEPGDGGIQPGGDPTWSVRVMLPDNTDPIPAVEDQYEAAGYTTEVSAADDGSYFNFNQVAYQLYASDFAGFDNGTYSVMVTAGVDSQKRPYADYDVQNTRTPPPPGQLQ